MRGVGAHRGFLSSQVFWPAEEPCANEPPRREQGSSPQSVEPRCGEDPACAAWWAQGSGQEQKPRWRGLLRALAQCPPLAAAPGYFAVQRTCCCWACAQLAVHHLHCELGRHRRTKR